MAEPPGNAYESGGVFQYVIVDAETNPTVKIFDLRIAETISEIKLRIKVQGYPPFKEKVAENVYSLDFEKLGYTEEPVCGKSLYESKSSIVITQVNAEIYVDYRSDLSEVMQEKEP